MTADSYTGEENDPLSLHLYTYCENDGVNMVDPSGHDAVDVLAWILKDGVMLVNNVSPLGDAIFSHFLYYSSGQGRRIGRMSIEDYNNYVKSLSKEGTYSQRSRLSNSSSVENQKVNRKGVIISKSKLRYKEVSKSKFRIRKGRINYINGTKVYRYFITTSVSMTKQQLLKELIKSAKEDSKAQKKVKEKIPNKLKTKDGRVDLSKFNKRKRGRKGFEGPNGWYIEKDYSHHAGSVWKLFDRFGNRIATLWKDGGIRGK